VLTIELHRLLEGQLNAIDGLHSSCRLCCFPVQLSNCRTVWPSDGLLGQTSVDMCQSAADAKRGLPKNHYFFRETSFKNYLPPLPIMRHIGLTEAHITLETN